MILFATVSFGELAGTITPLVVAVAGVMIHASGRAARDEERFVDIDRRLSRLEGHAGYDRPEP